MKVQNLTKAVLVALMVASPLASAESQYPAADFQPEIIKQDADLIAKHSSASAGSSTASSSNNSSSSSSSAASSSSHVTAAAPKQEESSNLTFLLIGVGLAAGVFLFTRKKGSASAPEATGGFAPAPAVSNNGATGVQNYVNTLSEAPSKAETGVQRFINALPASAPQAQTGVAKYIRSLPATETKPAAASEAPAAKGATGVEKYLNSIAGEAKPAAAAETGVAKYLKNQGLAA